MADFALLYVADGLRTMSMIAANSSKSYALSNRSKLVGSKRQLREAVGTSLAAHLVIKTRASSMFFGRRFNS